LCFLALMTATRFNQLDIAYHTAEFPLLGNRIDCDFVMALIEKNFYSNKDPSHPYRKC